MTLEQLEEAIPKFPRAKKGGELKLSTIKGYIDLIRIIARDLKGGDNVIKMLEDFTKVEDYLQAKKTPKGDKLAVNSLKKYYSALNISAKVANITPDAQKFYQTRLFNYMVRSEADRKNNYIPEKFGEALPKWKELSSSKDKFEGNNEFSLGHLIVSLYTLTPPRRLEYFSVKYLSKKPGRRPQIRPPQATEDVDADKVPYNYVYKEPKTGLYRIVLGDYKTVDNYGVFDNTYNKELSAIIDGYIQKQNLRSGMYLLINSKRKKFGRSGDQSNAVKDAFSVVYKDHAITLDNIRHIWTTSLHDNEFKVDIEGKDMTYREMTSLEKEELARLVGHSVIMSENYRQIRPRPQKKSKTQAEPQTSPSEPEDEPVTEPIDIETVQPESVEPPESVEMPSKDMATQTDGSGEAVTREDVLKSIKRYYDAKYEMIKKKMEMWDKVIS
jgi:hypothetical protein